QCPHYGLSELHQLDTFYNALNPNVQDALDSAAGGNFLDNIQRECLSIIKSRSKQIAASLKDKLDIRMNRFEKSLNDMKASFITPTAPIKVVEEVCVTCGANHIYNHCPLTRGNEFLIFHDNIQQFQTAAVGNFIQGNRIYNDIYSTIDACPNACEMWKAIERLKQGESINVQDLETNLFWEFGKFTSQDGESLGSYYSRFYKMMNELTRNQCNVTNHQVNVQFLLQLQPEWKRNRGKAIINSPQPIYDQEPSMVDDDDDERSKDKEIDKLIALISLSFKKIYKPTNNNLRTSSNTSRANQDNSPRIHKNAGECQKLKRAKDAAYHREKMLLCKQEEAGIQLNAEQADWKDDTDDESDDQELEAHYMYMAKLQQETMTTVNQGMSVEEIERVVAQRVANAIEAITIYETKTNISCDIDL
nr:reverse transcriptase domain-containing protein [Tanacetum cinerariifolium]